MTAAFHARYARPSPKSPAPRLPPTSSPALQPALHARTPISKPQTADAGTQYTPEGYPPTANTLAGSKRRGSSPPPPSMTSRPETNLPERPVHSATPDMSAQGVVAASQNASPSLSKKPRTQPDPNVKIMPLKYETCDPKDLGYLISNMLMELIRLNDKLPLNGRLTRFHSRAPPGISCHDYLQRLIQHATLSPPILLSIVYYIDRLCSLYPSFTISSLTVHRFLITAATVAAKGLSDSFWTNPTYARIGGISVSELATLEMEFLEKVQWRIVPKPEVLVDYYVSLVQRNEGYQLEAATESDPT
ncbi:cyclin-domain-containing protein [Aureobasidium pullulans]|uniref:Cyclin-domain-containing protein n=1 Tax=Aureobasidium pullulans TaxID=5580 RepID=A0A4S9AJB3_AURPU|nr:cyclin-domain-containing protein [Aureobasidium pullulans]